MSCRRYVRQDYEDIWHIHDLLSVGLGGTSFIDNMFTHSADHIGPYYESLAAGKLPFCSGGYIHKRKSGLLKHNKNNLTQRHTTQSMRQALLLSFDFAPKFVILLYQ